MAWIRSSSASKALSRSGRSSERRDISRQGVPVAASWSLLPPCSRLPCRTRRDWHPVCTTVTWSNGKLLQARGQPAMQDFDDRYQVQGEILTQDLEPPTCERERLQKLLDPPGDGVRSLAGHWSCMVSQPP